MHCHRSSGRRVGYASCFGDGMSKPPRSPRPAAGEAAPHDAHPLAQPDRQPGRARVLAGRPRGSSVGGDERRRRAGPHGTTARSALMLPALFVRRRLSANVMPTTSASSRTRPRCSRSSVDRRCQTPEDHVDALLTGDRDRPAVNAPDPRRELPAHVAQHVGTLRQPGWICAPLPTRWSALPGRGKEGPLTPATVDSKGDHRIAMTAAVLGLHGSGPTRITDCDGIATSLPCFVGTLRALGARIDVESDSGPQVRRSAGGGPRVVIRNHRHGRANTSHRRD